MVCETGINAFIQVLNKANRNNKKEQGHILGSNVYHNTELF